jgi:hypothetical protein
LTVPFTIKSSARRENCDSLVNLNPEQQTSPVFNGQFWTQIMSGFQMTVAYLVFLVIQNPDRISEHSTTKSIETTGIFNLFF